MRRSGKTTFMHQVREKRLADDHRAELMPFISFEDERLNRLSVNGLAYLVDEHYRLFPRQSRETVTWFFDEI